MSMTFARRFRGKVRDRYLELVREFPLISIRTEKELAAAQLVIDQLLSQGELSSGEEFYLDALGDLVGAYEDSQYRIEPASDAQMLRHLLDAKGISQAELHRSTGIAKSTLSEILAGKKPFSRQLIRTLAEFFAVDTGVLANNL